MVDVAIVYFLFGNLLPISLPRKYASVRTIVYESCTLIYYSSLQRITTGKECYFCLDMLTTH